MRTIKVYSPSELKKKHPKGFERAHEWYKSTNDEIPWQGEIMDSFKAIFDASGITIRDYEISCYSYSSITFEMDSDVRDLSGQRAAAWIENNLLSDLREKRPFQSRVKNYSGKWHDFTKYGEIPSCPFTGVCFDEDFIQSLIKSIKEGDSLGDAYYHLASVAAKLFENEIEYQNSEEYFLDQDHLEFTKEGHVI